MKLTVERKATNQGGQKAKVGKSGPALRTFAVSKKWKNYRRSVLKKQMREEYDLYDPDECMDKVEIHFEADGGSESVTVCCFFCCGTTWTSPQACDLHCKTSRSTSVTSVI